MIAYTCSFIISAGFISSERLSTFKLRHEAFKASLALRLVLSPARSPTVTLQLTARLYVLQVFYIARPPSKIYDLVVQPEADESRVIFRNAIDSLSTDHREILLLQMSGYEYEDIANQLQIKVAGLTELSTV